MPMIWFDQHMEMSEAMAHNIRPLSVLSTYGIWVLISVALFGLILLLTGLFLKLNNYWSTSLTVSQSETLLTNDDN